MNANAGIFFGLSAALCWGVADFCARGATRLGGTFRTLLAIQIIAVMALLVVGAPTGIVRLSGLPAGAMLIAALLSLIIMGGAALLYRAFAIGSLAIASPIAASYAAITALLALLTGEHPALAQLVGIALTLGGVVVVSAQPAHEDAEAVKAKQARGWRLPGGRRLAPGLIESLGAMLLFGFAYWALRFVVGTLGGVTTAFIGKLSDLIVLAALALGWLIINHIQHRGNRAERAHGAEKQDIEANQGILATDSRNERGWQLNVRDAGMFLVFVTPNALLDTAANIAYNIGITQALTSVVSVLASLFSPVTVLLAWIFLRERLTRWQWAGVVVIFVGVALVSI